MRFGMLGVHKSTKAEKAFQVPSSWPVHVASFVGGGLGAYVGGQLGHPVLGAMNGSAIARGAVQLLRRETTPEATAEDLAERTAATVGSIVLSPIAGYVIGTAGARWWLLRRKRAAIGAAQETWIFTDRDTIREVQKTLATLPAAESDPVFQITADGVMGPKTEAALYKFNKQYRGEPGDGSLITEGTLAALKINPLGVPTRMPTITAPSTSPTLPALPARSSASESQTPAPSGLQIFGRPAWQVALGGVGALALGGAVYLLASGAERAV